MICMIIILNTSYFSYAQDLEYAQQTIATLCASGYNGRGFLKRGDKKTASMIRNEFKKNGLEPLFNRYFQPFQIGVNTFPSAVQLALEDQLLIPGADFIVSPSAPSIRGIYPLHVMKADELIMKEVADLIPDNYRGFVCIDNRYSGGLDEKEKTLLSEKRVQLQNGMVPNASGIIELTSEKLAWGISGSTSIKPYIKVNHPVDPDTLNHITIKLKNRFRDKYTTNNIAGYIRGTECPDSFIVLTAHYDHLGQMGRETYFPGANDNASGVAMLLYLSKYFQQNRPRLSIAFISFSAEELGLLGSFYFVKHAPFDLGKIKFLINFDMVGTGNEGIKVVNGIVYPKTFNLLQEINNQNGYLYDVSGRSAACISDHCPFDYLDIPGFYIYTLGDSPDYHSIYDKPGTLSMIAFEGLANLIIRFVSHF